MNDRMIISYDLSTTDRGDFAVFKFSDGRTERLELPQQRDRVEALIAEFTSGPPCDKQMG